MAKKLTQLEEIRQNPDKFWLGPVVKIHEIREYTVAEYETIDYSSGENYGKPKGYNSFSCFLNGKGANFSTGSLDEALAYLMAYKSLGPNDGPRAGRFFMKMIVPEGDDE